jgi:hypothetical protein
MNKYLRTALMVVVGLATFYGLQYLRQRNEEPTKEAVAAVVSSMRAEAEKQHPEMAPTDALKQVASERAAKQLASESTLEQSNTASDMFWGFYWANTKVRPEYCASRGVDLTGFIQAFDRIHGVERDQAAGIYAARGVDAEKAVLPIILPELRKVIAQDMKDIAAGANAPEDQACALVAANADAFAQYIQLPAHVRKALFGER